MKNSLRKLKRSMRRIDTALSILSLLVIGIVIILVVVGVIDLVAVGIVNSMR